MSESIQADQIRQLAQAVSVDGGELSAIAAVALGLLQALRDVTGVRAHVRHSVLMAQTNMLNDCTNTMVESQFNRVWDSIEAALESPPPSFGTAAFPSSVAYAGLLARAC